MLVNDPWKRTADVVDKRYADNPDLIGQLMEKMGAKHVSVNGNEVRCTCPIHQGDNPRGFGLCVDEDGWVKAKCFTRNCGGHGMNLAGVVMRKYGCRYPQAVASLARLAGLQITGAGINVKPEQLHEESWDMVRRRLGADEQKAVIFAERWVKQAIAEWTHPSAVVAWDFLTGPLNTRTESGEKRKEFPREILQKFEVGFVPACTWLLPDPKDPSRRKGWFDDRICIPWRDWDGKCIGFAGRRFDGVDFCKYQTFHGTKKSLAWYGLDDKAREEIRRTQKIIVVEGYGDVWRARQHGIFNVISPGGTDISREQRQLLWRLNVAEVSFYLDSDEAGLVSSRRMADQLRDEMRRIWIGFPPAGFDPGDLLTREQYLVGIEHSTQLF